MELCDKAGKYGLGSVDVMQLLGVLTADLSVPYDIQTLACILFQPVEFEIFETKWS